MGFSRQEYWSGLPFPSPGDLPDPGTEPGSPTLEADALTSEPPGNRNILLSRIHFKMLNTWPTDLELGHMTLRKLESNTSYWMKVFLAATSFNLIKSMQWPRSNSQWDYWHTIHVALEKAMATHSSTLAWKIPWTEEPSRLQSMGSLGVRHDWSDLAAAATAHVARKPRLSIVNQMLQILTSGAKWIISVYLQTCICNKF